MPLGIRLGDELSGLGATIDRLLFPLRLRHLVFPFPLDAGVWQQCCVVVIGSRRRLPDTGRARSARPVLGPIATPRSASRPMPSRPPVIPPRTAASDSTTHPPGPPPASSSFQSS